MNFVDTLFEFYLEQWGWLLFLFIAGSIFIFVLINNHRRQLRALGWLIGLFLCLLTFIPAAIYSIGPQEARTALIEVRQLMFYVGMLGGIVPIMLLIGYLLTYRDTSPVQPVSPGLSGSPVPPFPQPGYNEDSEAMTQVSGSSPAPYFQTPETPQSERGFGPPPRERVAAWLVDVDTQRTYQLYKDKTQIGRNPNNDIVLTDVAVSGQHVLIRQQGALFFIQDIGSTYGTLINEFQLEGREQLNIGDIITLGDTRLRFTHGERSE